MNRIIKFRAWDKVVKEYSVIDFEIEDLMSGIAQYKEFQIWEQFTGLTDKNGKEIFEGDIVKFKVVSNYQLPIQFNNGSFQPKGWANINLKDCEVIGNIHQNPELLES